MLMLSESFGMPEAQTDPQLTDAIKIAGKKFIYIFFNIFFAVRKLMFELI